MIKNEKIMNLYQDIVISWFPFLVCFIIIPSAIYIPNQTEFGNNLWTIVPFFICCGLSFFALMGLRYLPPVFRFRLAKGLFLLGTFLMLSDILAPLQWGLFDGEEILKEPIRLTLIELPLAIGIVLCSFALQKKQVRGFGTTMVIAFFAVQMVYLLIGVSGGNSSQQSVKNVGNTEPNRPSVNNLGNVYHIVFDAYSSGIFMDSVRRLGVSTEFDGFTFFERNLSNYVVTNASTPSYLTGSFYKNGSFNAWQRQAVSGGLRKRLQEIGYEISLYVPNRSRYWMFDNATQIKTSHELAKSYYVPGADQSLLAQISLVRVTPNFLRKEVNSRFNNAYVKILRWLGYNSWKDYKQYKSLSVPLFQQFLEDEAKRSKYGNYIYLHVILPHQPFRWTCNCEQSNDPTDFSAQTDCSTRLMTNLIQTLKKSHKFESSTIIFQSDHGYHGKGGGKPKTEIQPSNDVLEKIAMKARYFSPSPEGFFRRLHSLLVIKPPFTSSTQLIISKAPSQLADIPATIYKALSMKEPKNDGTSVYDLRESEEREINIFAGIYTKDSKGRALVLGRNQSATKIAHISYQAGVGWRIYKDISAIAE